jgi:hypothetical protein
MHRRTWEAQPKAMSVIEGLKGQPVPPRGPEPQLRPAPNNQWRDPVRAHAPHALEGDEHSRTEARLEQANVRLKPLVAAWLLEGKTSDAGWG